MMYDGRQYRRNRHLGFRIAQDHAWRDEGRQDVYAEGGFTTDAGQPITGMQVVILRIKDAKTTVVGERMYYDAATVPPEKCIPICAHSATNVALGVPRLRKAGMSDIVSANIGRAAGHAILPGQDYVEQAHYLVRDGKVYQWTSRRLAKPEDRAA